MCEIRGIVPDIKNFLKQYSVQDVSLCRGGAVPRGEVCKIGEAPARGAARSAAEGRRRRPKAGDAFRGGVTRPVPLTRNLPGKHRTSPESFPAERVLPAPRAGERTLFAFLQWENPLRPAPGTVRNPIRAGEILCITTLQPSRAPLAETFVPRLRAGDTRTIFVEPHRAPDAMIRPPPAPQAPKQ